MLVGVKQEDPQRGIRAVETALVLLEGAIDYLPARNRDGGLMDETPADDVAEAARSLRHALLTLPKHLAAKPNAK
jgi:hypothetical protein